MVEGGAAIRPSFAADAANPRAELRDVAPVEPRASAHLWARQCLAPSMPEVGCVPQQLFLGTVGAVFTGCPPKAARASRGPSNEHLTLVSG